ncbi:MAG: hypothetical protein HY472_01205 [Candidatus Sungbacteria bacterium]|nr:hypothetical protein [Candidatus Sungbacteria bacterium]
MTSFLAILTSPVRLPFRLGRVSAGAGAFFLALLFIGMSRAVFSTRLQLERIRTDLALLEQRQRAAFAFADMTKRRKTDIDRIRTLFVDPNRPLNFIEHVEELARRTKTRVSLGTETPKQGEPGLLFRITAEGSTQAIRAMHALIEAAPFAIRQERVLFQRLEERQDGGEATPPSGRLAITVRVFTR